MKVCELGSPVVIKADKYGILAAKNWQIILVCLILSKLTPDRTYLSVFVCDICRRLCDIVTQKAKTLLAPNHYVQAREAREILAHFWGIGTKIRELSIKFGPSLVHFLLHFCRSFANTVPEFFSFFCPNLRSQKNLGAVCPLPPPRALMLVDGRTQLQKGMK